MYPLFVILIVIAAVLMIAIVLIQESKGGGLSSGFSSGNQIMGVRKTTDFVEKTTWALAAFMVVVSVACAYTAPQTETNDVLKDMATPAQQKTAPTTVPGFGASEQKDAADAKADAAPAADAKADAATETAAPAAEAAPAADAKAEAAPAEEKK